MDSTEFKPDFPFDERGCLKSRIQREDKQNDRYLFWKVSVIVEFNPVVCYKASFSDEASP